MRRLPYLLLLFLLFAAFPARAEPPGQRFVATAFHNVVDNPADLETDAVTTKTLVQFFDWLKGTGWTAVSLDDLAAAAHGTRPLPDKAILITFDDGYESLYTRVFPLLEAYHFPAVSALVGSWMEDRPDGMVLYGDKTVPRTDFISWDQAREMQATGLVEFASHSYELHRSVQANPQGNMEPAVAAWRFDPGTGTYEDDAHYQARIRADLTRARAMMAAKLGHPPRAIVWPYGRYTGPALDVAKQLGFRFAITLDPEPAYTSDLFAIHRYHASQNPSLADLVRNLRFEPSRPKTQRIACLTLDGLAAVGRGPAQDEMLGHIIEGLRALGANIVIIDANASLPSAGAPLAGVYFPTRLRPLSVDLLGRATWQIRTRAGADVFLRLPLDAAIAGVGAANVPELFADMLRYVRADGITLDLQPPATGTPIVADQPGEIRARRAALDRAGLDPRSRLGLEAYRAAAAIDPRIRLMLALQAAGNPPDWADIGLLPPGQNAEQIAGVAARLRAAGWLRPDVAGRIAFSLPSDPIGQVEALRIAQRQGASAFALCPEPPVLPPPPALAASFSASTYPYKP